MGLIGVAGVALAIGAAFQGERLPEDQRPVVVGASDGGDSGGGSGTDAASGDGDNGGGGSASGDAAPPTNPIEGFLPRSGEASACREPVGVDLIAGYAAKLTINGVAIPPEEMNVNIDADGRITDEVTASRSLSLYTFGPEEDCPNGEILRATDNVMRVCVYRLVDGPASCVTTEVRFDVL